MNSEVRYILHALALFALAFDAVCLSRTVQAAPASQSITVEDLVRFATIGNPQSLDWRGQSNLAKEIGVLSPDGQRVALVVHRGNPEQESNEGSLLVYNTADLLRDPDPDLVVQFASTGNYEPIAYVRWLQDSETLVFAGTRGEQRSQVYRLNVGTRKFGELTHESGQLLWYDIAPSGKQMVTLSELTNLPPAEDPNCRRRGCRVTSDWLYFAQQGIPDSSAPLSVHDLQSGATRVIANPEVTDNGIEKCDDALLGSMSPDGRYALRMCELREQPAWWGDYTVSPILAKCWEIRNSGQPDLRCGRVAVRIDLKSGVTARLIDVPFIALVHAKPLWIDGGRYLILPGAVQQLSSVDARERESRATEWAVLLVDPLTLESKRIGRLGSEVAYIPAATWDDKAQVLTMQVQDGKHAALPVVSFKREAQRWLKVVSPAAAQAANKGPGVHLVIEQSLNDPPVLMAVDEQTGLKRRVLDPNKWLAKRELGRVEAITWISRNGSAWSGGLYYPPNYAKGNRYPMVMQTHGFDPNRFPWTGERGFSPVARWQLMEYSYYRSMKIWAIRVVFPVRLKNGQPSRRDTRQRLIIWIRSVWLIGLGSVSRDGARQAQGWPIR